MSKHVVTDGSAGRLQDLGKSDQRRILEDVEKAVKFSKKGMHHTARETVRSVGRIVPEGSLAAELYKKAIQAFRRGDSAPGRGLPGETSEAITHFETFREHLRELGTLTNVSRTKTGPAWDTNEEVPR